MAFQNIVECLQVRREPATKFTALHFLHYLLIDPESECYTTQGWKGLLGSNSQANEALSPA
jgi:hypothetical protein